MNGNGHMYRPLQRPPIPPQQPAPPPPKNLPPFVRKILANKTLLVFAILALVMGISTTSYILVATSQDKQSVITQAAFPTATPYPLVTAEPTPTEVPLSPSLTPKPTAKPTPTPTLSPTANWNTYVNSQYGYTIKYPINWTATNWGILEPKVPSYIVFNDNTATASARYISIGISTRSYAEQMVIEGATGSAITISGVAGTKQDFKDSDGNKSTSVILRRSNDLLILRSKTPYTAIFNLMLSTLKITKQ